MVGKWDLGHADEKFWPQHRGFDHFYGNLVGEIDYFTKERGDIIDWQRDGRFIKEEGYHTTLIGDEAVRLIEAQDPGKPFFLYFASLAAHSPYQVPKEYSEQYASIPNEKRRAYAGMITALDDQIGRIVAVLEARHLRESTLIVFASDNGGATSAMFATGARSEDERKSSGDVGLGEKPPASNGAFRGGKGSIYEGGVRVPAFFNWPSRLRKAIVNQPIAMIDVMPTLLGLAGAKGSDDHPFDGTDVWSTLTGQAISPRAEYLIQVEAIRGAIRQGDWKLVRMATLPGRTELFNLANDPGEQHNLATRHPDIVKKLDARLVDYARQMKPSEWIKAQPAFVSAQSGTVFDADFDIDDGGLPREKTVIPGR